MRRKTEWPGALGGATLRDVGKHATDEKKAPLKEGIAEKATPRVKRLAEMLDATIKKRGLTRGEVARRTGIHPTNVSNFLNKKEGVGADRALRYMDALGLAIRDTTLGEPLAVGHVGPGATLQMDVSTLSFPCTAKVVVPFGKYLPGDVLHLRESSSFEPGKWLLIERGDGRVFALAEDRPIGKVLVLADGEELLFSPARHKIIACVFGCFRLE